MPQYQNWTQKIIGDFTEIWHYHLPEGRKIEVRWHRSATGETRPLLPDGDPESTSYWSIKECGVYIEARLTLKAAMNYVEETFKPHKKRTKKCKKR